ncbi:MULTISPECIES: peptidase M29 [unclassified Pusillimonas]|uniref:peptidase M29 n=1 Tax=unclassified Pusillimonas TaxID=2640016 RepID=UPI000B9D2197|nr:MULTISPECIES: peptidase M29 [unclassified Pusillimonas]OXR48910.1 peptidase M29 [Pusillimonas sp. T2]ROT45755.1 peptidase M29 [Pusillimonas sp. NJUB218]
MKIQEKWIRAFEIMFRKCKVETGEIVRLLTETESRSINVQLAELALARMGAIPVQITVPSLAINTPVPVRSTGASHVIQNMAPVIQALSGPGLVVDLTVEGLLHSPELPGILGSGARVLMVSNEHPETLERLTTDQDLTAAVKKGVKMLANAKVMTVTSAAGTHLTIDLNHAKVGGVWGGADRPGLVQHWPGGICLAFPAANTVNGTLVMDIGDVNLTFKRYLEQPVTLHIENDYVARIEGKNLDAELMRSYMAAWQDRDAYAVSHVGWGMNPQARWDALQMFDKADTNGTELRAFAGNFLYSTGANDVAGRHTLGHFDLPMRHCTVALDGITVVDQGQLCNDVFQ